MMDLASHQEGLTHRSDISARQGIPMDYMDQILIRLKEHQLIESTRGRAGGYRLGRLARLISTFDIFKAVEDGFAPVQCLDQGTACFAEHFCQSKDAWSTISSAITESLSGIILADLVAARQGVGITTNSAHECRAPRRTLNQFGPSASKEGATQK